MSARKLRKHLRAIAAFGCIAAALAATVAAARTTSTHLEAGNLEADLGFFFSPTAMPRTEFTPIEAGGFAKLGTKDGSVPPPLTHITFEVDENSDVETRGLPTCTKGQLVATTPQRARKACKDAIVGTGRGSGVVVFPEQAPIPASSPVTIFNGPPIGGDPTVIVHAHLTVPAPTTYLVAVRIERVNKGPIGYRIDSDIPRIAGGYGSVKDFRFEIDRKWRFKGKELSYLNARCPKPGPHLFGFVGVEFADDTAVRGSLFTSCEAR
jgi:hypothetical protein